MRQNVSAETFHTVILDAPAVRPREYEHSVVGAPDSVTALVHEPVVEAAQRDQIGEVRFAPVRPVLDVVPVAEARAIAAGEPATPIASTQRSGDGRRDAAGLSADVE